MGILLAWQHSLAYVLLLIGGSGRILIDFLRAGKRRQAAVVTVALLLSACCGFFRFSQETEKREAYAAYLAQEMPIQLQGTIYKKETKDETNRIYLKQCHVNIQNHIISTNRAVVYLDQISYQIGNKVLVKGTSAGLQEASNEGGFDEKKYYESQMQDWKIYADSVKIIENNTAWLSERLYEVRQRIKGVYLSLMPEKEGGTLAAISLGEKGAMDQELRQKYQTNGISHILAISGVKTQNLAIPLTRRNRINSAFVPLHIAKIYILKTVLRRGNYSPLSFPLFKGVSQKIYKLAKEAII